MSPETEALRHQLADRLDGHPVREWSAPLLAAIIGVLDVVISEGLQERPAVVLQLVPPAPAR